MRKSQTLEVLIFSIKENLKKKGILLSTILIACVCVLALPIIAYITLADKNESKDEKIEKI